MKKERRRAAEIELALRQRYPIAECSLRYEKDYELLFATRLAAQCTDARVNVVTAALFRAYPTLQSIAEADPDAFEQAVRSTGFYRHKARDIIASANALLREHGGRVPDTMEELLKLPGVGRKTANLMLGDLFGKPAVVVDTHCIRITNLLGLCDTRDPLKIELRLRELLEPELTNDFCHRLVLHGRDTCVARRPLCGGCVVRELCRAYTGAGGDTSGNERRGTDHAHAVDEQPAGVGRAKKLG
jgi:endonuclease-3